MEMTILFICMPLMVISVIAFVILAFREVLKNDGLTVQHATDNHMNNKGRLSLVKDTDTLDSALATIEALKKENSMLRNKQRQFESSIG